MDMKKFAILLLSDMTEEELAEIVEEVPQLCLRNCGKNESPYCSGEYLKESKDDKNLRDLLVALDMVKCLGKKDKK